LVEKEQQAVAPFFKQLSATEIKQAETFLSSKSLLKKTNELIGKYGVIGEENNRQKMFVISTSRKTKNPLHQLGKLPLFEVCNFKLSELK
jgi:hypothetical protein